MLCSVLLRWSPWSLICSGAVLGLSPSPAITAATGITIAMSFQHWSITRTT